jgi:hypothetical protein
VPVARWLLGFSSKIVKQFWSTALRVALAAPVLLLGGCGQLGASYTGFRLNPRVLVDQKLIDRYPPRTPQRTLLQWYGALQQGDITHASAFYAPWVRITPRGLAFIRTAESRYFMLAPPPAIVGILRSQTRTTVFTVIEFHWRVPNGRSYVYRRPQAFDLQQLRGEWRLADDYFVTSGPPYLIPNGPCSTC